MKILKPIAMLFIMLLFISCTGDSDNNEPNPVNVDDTNLSAIEAEILQLVNNHRRSQGSGTLEHNEIAYEAALEHTNYMISQEGSVMIIFHKERMNYIRGSLSRPLQKM